MSALAVDTQTLADALTQTGRAVPYIQFGRAVCGELAAAESREWWLSNGLGAYAAGTLAQTLTRRYHGLLVAPVVPPLGRHLTFAKADAVLRCGEKTWPLHTNRWQSGAVTPRGHVHIESFHLDGRMPVWHYAIGAWRIEHRIWLEPGANTVYLAYRLLDAADETLELDLALLINARDHHTNTSAEAFAPVIIATGDGTRLTVQHEASDRPTFALNFAARGGTFRADHTWYRDFHLSAEQARGLPTTDNHLCAGTATLRITADEWVGISASLEHPAPLYLNEALRRFVAHDQALVKRAQVVVAELRSAPTWVLQLVRAADDFVFARPLPSLPQGQSIIAGYPWFGDWGRDTMIALPGLLLATGRHEAARTILQTFAQYIDGGMLPNYFPAHGETPEYNTVDAALWFIEAWRAYFDVVQDERLLREIFPVLAEIVAAHVNGTRYGIKVDPVDGLLAAGVPGVQLTWMDAKLGDWVVTPRQGKPVEINALWFNALMTIADFATRLKLDAAPYRARAAQVSASFTRFVRPDAPGLFDVLDGPDGHDASVRPNQIFAVSLCHSPLTAETQASVVHCCGEQLLCSYGLRSLTPTHPAYRGQYVGDARSRDASYHQGPAWAWLLGHFALAEYRATGDAARAQARLAPIETHLFDAGLGTVSELFDGDPPHTARGAPSQAWSVACTLEAWWKLERAKHTAIPGIQIR